MPVESLNERRADLAHDNSLWSPLECLQALVREVEAGRIAMDAVAIHYWETDPQGRRRHHGMYLSNLDHAEHIAMLAMAQHEAIEYWKA